MKNHAVLKTHFHDALVKLRRDSDLTQEQMAQRFHMSLRCYCSLESGKSGCSAMTLLRYLLLCDDPLAFLEEMRTALESEKAGAV